MPGPRDRGREINVGVLMLLYQLQQFGFAKIPPVTLAGIAVMSMMFTGMINVPWSKEDACVSSNAVLKNRDYRRLFISAFEHGDDMHLYYNMISFLVKGVNLERKLGSPYFAYLNLVFASVCSLVYIGLANAMAGLTRQPLYLDQCAIGFSAVLFALKVLVSAYSVSWLVHLAPGIVVPSHWAYWLELVLIQVMVPNASFIGHLAGILVGLLFVRGPLKLLMDLPFIVLTGRMTPDPRIEMHEEMDEMDILMPDEAKRRRAYRQQLEDEMMRRTTGTGTAPRGGGRFLDTAPPPPSKIPAAAASGSFGVRRDWLFGRPSYTYASGVSGRRVGSSVDAGRANEVPAGRSRQEYEEERELQEALDISRAEFESKQQQQEQREFVPSAPAPPPEPRAAPYGWHVGGNEHDDDADVEEIRRRRLERFGVRR